jgi:hypothetical protein
LAEKNIVLNLLQKVRSIGKPKEVPAAVVTQGKTIGEEEKQLLRSFGVTMQTLTEMMYKQSLVNYERFSLYQELDRSLLHPLMGAAVELYADVSTTYSQLHNASVWITARSSKYENELNALLDQIGIEEKIFDWAWTTAAYGDLFIRVNGEKGLGITSVEDSEHPMNVSRLDFHGRLIGFYESPLGNMNAAQDRKLIPPWEYVHCRILGVKKKRPVYGDPTYTEYATTYLMAPDKRRVSSKYGTSVLTNGLPVYKRLRLTEDSLLLARLSKGMLRYIYKVKVDGSNMDAVSELIDEYKTLLKRARALDTGTSNPYFNESYEPMGVNEDIIIPVWGDVGDLSIEKIGGEADIRFITDVEELRNQLASALRVPLQLLGGYPGEMPQGLGRGAIERYDIRFARQARRLQRALIDTITRLCQIHLAYQGMNPSTDMFEVNMSETSTAEEEELKDSLNVGVDVVQKMVDMVINTLGESVDRLKLLDYLNQKILKLEDLDLTSLLKAPGTDIKDSLTAEVRKYKELYEKEMREKKEGKVRPRIAVMNTDVKAFLPIKEGRNEDWDGKYKDMKITVEPQKVEK